VYFLIRITYNQELWAEIYMHRTMASPKPAQKVLAHWRSCLQERTRESRFARDRNVGVNRCWHTSVLACRKERAKAVSRAIGTLV